MKVPHVTAWSSEQWQRSEMCPHAGDVALMTSGRQGKGAPQWGVIHEPRQRECTTRGICQICADPLGVRHFAIWETDQRIEIGGEEWYLTSEPACCEECYAYAEIHCPRLRDGAHRVAVSDNYRVDTRLIVCRLGNFEVPPRKGPGLDQTVTDRLNRAAKRHGGIVGVVKTAVDPAILR